ncbi:MAG TPA: OmpH family outer membrane protein [Rhodothermales bacterium]|nr:OmpH family outer membrane protein [Rhodothermales bacterium]
MKQKFYILVLLAGLGVLVAPGSAWAQQKVGYVDSDYILDKLPEYATVQQQMDRQAQEWQATLDKRKKEVDEMFKDYQARELLFTNEERQQKRNAIMQAEDELEQQRMQYFGPEGQLFTQQQQLMKPIQERILTAVETIAKEGGYDYIFDKNGGMLFLYARDQYNLSDRVLQELGVDVDNLTTGNR